MTLDYCRSYRMTVSVRWHSHLVSQRHCWHSQMTSTLRWHSQSVRCCSGSHAAGQLWEKASVEMYNIIWHCFKMLFNYSKWIRTESRNWNSMFGGLGLRLGLVIEFILLGTLSLYVLHVNFRFRNNGLNYYVCTPSRRGSSFWLRGWLTNELS